MIQIAPRTLTPAECAVVAAAVQRAPLDDGNGAAGYDQVETLWVVGRCECGCASLFFTSQDWVAGQYQIADGLGETSEGEKVGIILWATPAGLVHLELYTHGESPAGLPVPSSIRNWSAAKP